MAQSEYTKDMKFAMDFGKIEDEPCCGNCGMGFLKADGQVWCMHWSEWSHGNVYTKYIFKPSSYRCKAWCEPNPIIDPVLLPDWVKQGRR